MEGGDEVEKGKRLAVTPLHGNILEAHETKSLR